MDLTEEELKKPVDDIVPPRLEALLELALRMSTANTDPFKDDLKVGKDTEPLQFYYYLFVKSRISNIRCFFFFYSVWAFHRSQLLWSFIKFCGLSTDRPHASWCHHSAAAGAGHWDEAGEGHHQRRARRRGAQRPGGLLFWLHREMAAVAYYQQVSFRWLSHFSHIYRYVPPPLHPQRNSGFTRYPLRNAAYLFPIWTVLFTCGRADNTFLFFAQESSDEVPDVVPAHVLLQTRRKAAVQRRDQQQRLQAVLFTLSQMVRNSPVWTWERGDIHFHTTQTCCVQVCRCVCPQTAHVELCAKHPVLHDVWGDGAQLAYYGEQPEDGEFMIQEMHKFRVKCEIAKLWFSAGVKHWWRSLPPHQLPGQLPEGLHVDQPGASQNLLQTDGCLHHVHKLHAGANVLTKKIWICNSYFCLNFFFAFFVSRGSLKAWGWSVCLLSKEIWMEPQLIVNMGRSQRRRGWPQR